MIRPRFVLALTATILAPLQARALPPPKTEAELLQLADLVVDADATAISCDGAPVVDPQKTTTKYLSTLFPSQSYKGGLPNSFQVRGYTEVWVGPPPTGGWHQEPIAKGWSGKLYLKKELDGTYTKVWWNAMTEDTAKSKPQPLPTCGASADGGPKGDGVAKSDGGPKPDASPKSDGGPKLDAAPKSDGAPAKLDGPATSDGAPAKSDGAPAKSDAAAKPDAAATPASSDGCSCAIRDAGASGLPLVLLIGLGLALLRRRARGR